MPITKLAKVIFVRLLLSNLFLLMTRIEYAILMRYQTFYGETKWIFSRKKALPFIISYIYEVFVDDFLDFVINIIRFKFINQVNYKNNNCLLISVPDDETR